MQRNVSNGRTQSEVARILESVQPRPKKLMCSLMYGAGLRLMEACRLRVKDIGVDRQLVMVREGKGEKDRSVPLPQRLVSDLSHQIELVRRQQTLDINAGAGWVWVPYALAVKWPNAGRELGWHLTAFPSKMAAASTPVYSWRAGCI